MSEVFNEKYLHLGKGGLSGVTNFAKNIHIPGLKQRLRQETKTPDHLGS